MRLTLYTEGPAFGGAEQYLATLLNSLPLEEFDLACVCTYPNTLSSLQNRVSREDIEFVLFDMGKQPSVWKTVWPLSRLIASLDPDIVHCSGIDGYAASYAVLASRLAGVGAILGGLHMSREYPRSRGLNKLFRFIVDRSLDAAIAVSESTRKVAIEHRGIDPDRIAVIYPGIPMLPELNASRADQRGAGSPGTIMVGTAARLAPTKDLGTMLQAAAMLDRSVNDIQFVIIGDGPDRDHLVALARELGLRNSVRFTGWQASVVPMLQSLDIYVQSSVTEASGIAIMEAMSCGLPVVATNVGGVPEVVANGRTGLLVPPRNPKALAEAIQELARDGPKRKQMGLAGQHRAQTLFSATRMIEQTRLYYHQMLAPTR